jgi:hypothetical protein
VEQVARVEVQGRFLNDVENAAYRKEQAGFQADAKTDAAGVRAQLAGVEEKVDVVLADLCELHFAVRNLHESLAQLQNEAAIPRLPVLMPVKGTWRANKFRLWFMCECCEAGDGNLGPHVPTDFEGYVIEVPTALGGAVSLLAVTALVLAKAAIGHVLATRMPELPNGLMQWLGVPQLAESLNGAAKKFVVKQAAAACDREIERVEQASKVKEDADNIVSTHLPIVGSCPAVPIAVVRKGSPLEEFLMGVMKRASNNGVAMNGGLEWVALPPTKRQKRPMAWACEKCRERLNSDRTSARGSKKWW